MARGRSRIASGAVARVQGKLLALPDQVQAPIRRLVDEAGDTALATANRRVPVEHGDLRDGITLTRTGPLGWILAAKAIAKRGRVRFNYAWFVEFGRTRATVVKISKRGKRTEKRTLGTGARPFLFPAYRPAKRKFRGAIGREVRRVLAMVSNRR